MNNIFFLLHILGDFFWFIQFCSHIRTYLHRIDFVICRIPFFDHVYDFCCCCTAYTGWHVHCNIEILYWCKVHKKSFFFILYRSTYSYHAFYLSHTRPHSAHGMQSKNSCVERNFWILCVRMLENRKYNLFDV